LLLTSATAMRTILPLPLYAATGFIILFSQLFSGGTVVCLPQFEVNEWLTAISEERGEMLMVAPSLCLELLAADTRKYAACRYAA